MGKSVYNHVNISHNHLCSHKVVYPNNKVVDGTPLTTTETSKKPKVGYPKAKDGELYTIGKFMTINNTLIHQTTIFSNGQEAETWRGAKAYLGGF